MKRRETEHEDSYLPGKQFQLFDFKRFLEEALSYITAISACPYGSLSCSFITSLLALIFILDSSIFYPSA